MLILLCRHPDNRHQRHGGAKRGHRPQPAAEQGIDTRPKPSGNGDRLCRINRHRLLDIPKPLLAEKAELNAGRCLDLLPHHSGKVDIAGFRILGDAQGDADGRAYVPVAVDNDVTGVHAQAEQGKRLRLCSGHGRRAGRNFFPDRFRRAQSRQCIGEPGDDAVAGLTDNGAAAIAHGFIDARDTGGQGFQRTRGVGHHGARIIADHHRHQTHIAHIADGWRMRWGDGRGRAATALQQLIRNLEREPLAGNAVAAVRRCGQRRQYRQLVDFDLPAFEREPAFLLPCPQVSIHGFAVDPDQARQLGLRNVQYGRPGIRRLPGRVGAVVCRQGRQPFGQARGKFLQGCLFEGIAGAAQVRTQQREHPETQFRAGLQQLKKLPALDPKQRAVLGGYRLETPRTPIEDSDLGKNLPRLDDIDGHFAAVLVAHRLCDAARQHAPDGIRRVALLEQNFAGAEACLLCDGSDFAQQ